MKSDVVVVVMAVMLAAFVFAVDQAIPLGVAGGVPYVAVVALTMFSPRRSLAIGAALACTLLVWIGFFASPSPGGAEMWKVLVNRSLAVLAIAVVTIMVVQQQWVTTLRKRSPTGDPSGLRGSDKFPRSQSSVMRREPMLWLFIILLMVAGGVLAWHQWRLQNDLVERAALEDAKAYSEALTAFRTLYSSEVVERLRAHDVLATDDYEHQGKAIPLPATMTMLLGKNIGQSESDVRVELYSPYPFPNRVEQDKRRAKFPHDDFSAKAWGELKDKPDVPVYRTEVVDGRRTLRYATADIMRESCVRCHNSHDDSPKRNWAVGEVRGVLEVDVPIERMAALSATGLRQSLTLLVVFVAVSFSGVVLVVARLRRSADELERRVDQRTEELLTANKQLEVEIAERKKVLHELEQQAEQLVASRTAALNLMQDIDDARHRAEQAEQKTKRYADQLERSNQELDDFAYIVSHDLKEPLRGITSYANFIVEDYRDQLDDEGREMLETLTRLCTRMTDLIEALLHYSRVGRAELAVQETDLNEMLDEVIDSLHVAIAEQNVEVRIPRPLPTIRCDSVRVREIYRNLITNAYKYNDKPEKWIEIGFRPRHRSAHANTVEKPYSQDDYVFYVRDNGIGIREKHREAIFGMFKRLHGRDQFGGGTGAGLTFVKKIIERHGGRIWVESTYGEETTFYFTLN